MDERRLQLTIESRLTNVALLGGAIRSSCLAVGMDESAAGEVELAVVEVVNNCIEHAYRKTDDGQVSVSLEISDHTLRIKVSDRGRAMPPEVLATATVPTFDPGDTAHLPEGGMGLGIVKQLMQDVHYESTGGTNVLTMVRRL
ncbi:MAG TPA: ATP-binding protein [Polyangia bacterium]